MLARGEGQREDGARVSEGFPDDWGWHRGMPGRVGSDGESICSASTLVQFPIYCLKSKVTSLG